MSRLRPDRHTMRLALLVLLGLAAGACADTDPPGVTVEAIQSDLTFGVEPDTPVANFDPAPTTDPAAVQQTPEQVAELPPQSFDPVTRSNTVPTFTAGTSPPPAPCPEATIDEFPDESASFWRPEERKEPPREGLYRWQRSGSVRSGSEEFGTELPVTGFERRAIRNVEIITDEERTDDEGNDLIFTYEVVQPEVGTQNTVVTTYRMRTNGRSQTVFSPVDQTQVRAGEPDRGLQIERIEVVDPEGNSDVFEPSVPLLIFPIDVVPGDRFSASSVDPRTRVNVRIEAHVQARDRVDACGDLVEGWLVTSTLTRSSGGEEVVRSYDYMVAPQYGGIIISEHIYEPGDDPDKRSHDAEGHAGGAHDLLLQLGQQDPDPLPAGGQP